MPCTFHKRVGYELMRVTSNPLPVFKNIRHINSLRCHEAFDRACALLHLASQEMLHGQRSFASHIFRVAIVVPFWPVVSRPAKLCI